MVKLPFESFLEYKQSLSEVEGIEAFIYLFEEEKVLTLGELAEVVKYT